MNSIIISIPNLWICFLASSTLTMIFAYIMHRQSLMLFTRIGTKKKFSVMDLEFPSSSVDLRKVLSGINKLEPKQIIKTKKALKGNLYVDFLFMPFAYFTIFLLCMHIADRNGNPVFAILAWLQVITWICDLWENSYILKIYKSVNSVNSVPAVNLNCIDEKNCSTAFDHYKEESGFIVFKYMVRIKWAIALAGLICSLLMLFYYWITRQYNTEALPYLYMFFGVVILFIIISMFSKKKVDA